MTGGGWGPGAPSPDVDLSGSAEPEDDSSEDEDQDPGQEEESTQEAVSGSQQELAEWEAAPDRFDGSVYNAMELGGYGFLPVFGFNEANIAARKYTKEYGFEDNDTTINLRDDEPLMIDGKELTWWEDESIMPKHPMMLVNPLGFASVDPDVHNFRNVFRVSKGEHFVFSDSGGYQLMSMTGEDGKTEAKIVDSEDEHSFTDYRIYPERLMEWQTQNADAGATIDYPPYNISGASSFPDAAEYGEEWREFYEMRKDKSAEMTKRMAARLRGLRNNDDEQAQDYIFSPVIHGKPNPEGLTHSFVMEWHKAMEKAAGKANISPRGWVMKPEPATNAGQIALHLGYAAEYLQDADYLHMLMVGGLLQKSLIMYYAKRSEHFVTSDASSYAAGGKRRQFDLPKTATRRSVIISSRDDEDENAALNPNRLTKHPCRCQVCSSVENDVGFEFISQGSGSARSVTLNLHNLQQSLMVERTIDALLREEDVQIVETEGEPTGCEFWRYLGSMASDARIRDLYNAMDYVRLAQEEGLSEANDVYEIKWDKSGGKTLEPYTSNSAAEADW